MGKNKNKRRQVVQEKPQAVLPKAVQSAAAKHVVAFPLPFPPSLPYPKKAFLRDEAPYTESFQHAIETSYEGFVVDAPNVMEEHHKAVDDALATMEAAGFFRVDVTQPFGLGTKCAKTYVTRCLVGEPGTTYKYLGLRMFSHSWQKPIGTASSSSSSQTTRVKHALETIGNLNTALTLRTQKHLSDLDMKRRARGSELTRGRAGFDVALINRMESPVGLKDEPSMGQGKCSVSWHADSSLEHFSNIAVYHLLDKEPNTDGKWSVGLRVAHNSEGPQASRRGTDISVVSDTPPLAVSLPSGCTYYMLDDFNHHHQHAVIAEGKIPGRRFSSTHRLLRDSHNVSHIIARCRSVCTHFHKRGPKVWRSEQLLLTEMESEWLRQFFIQGKAHHDILWTNNWDRPIEELLKFWSQLEERTKQTIDWLQFGAEGQCGLDQPSSHGPAPPRSERKLREKRKKAREGIHDLITRGESSTNSVSPRKDLYEPMAELLEERATMRELWLARQDDGVFHELSRDNRPMPLPVDFLQDGTREIVGRGQSPMPGSPKELRELAANLRKWGVAYESGDMRDLPASSSTPTSIETPVQVQLQSDDHCKPPDWNGWKTHAFGLEMQDPWARHVLSGAKSIETRSYDLPPALIGKKIAILQSRQGRDGVSAVNDTLDLSSGTVELVGWCIFDRVCPYRDQAAFNADEARHMVKRDSEYSWKAGSTEVIYGWMVSKYGSYNTTTRFTTGTAIRRMRSLFELQVGTDRSKRKTLSITQAPGRRNRSKRRKK